VHWKTFRQSFLGVLRGSIGCWTAKGRITKILEGPGVPSHGVPQRWKRVLSIYSTVVRGREWSKKNTRCKQAESNSGNIKREQHIKSRHHFPSERRHKVLPYRSCAMYSFCSYSFYSSTVSISFHLISKISFSLSSNELHLPLVLTCTTQPIRAPCLPLPFLVQIDFPILLLLVFLFAPWRVDLIVPPTERKEMQTWLLLL